MKEKVIKFVTNRWFGFVTGLVIAMLYMWQEKSLGSVNAWIMGHYNTAALRSVRRGGEICNHGGHVQVEEPAVVARGSCHRSSGDACGIAIPSAPGGSKKPRPVNIDANHLLTQTLQMRGRGICPLPHL